MSTIVEIYIKCIEHNCARKENSMRMEQGSRNSHNADFEQFSKFLNSSPRHTRGAMPCNSANGNTQAPVTNGAHTPSLAMVYAVKQPWQSIYDPEIALVNGTIFEELHKPFYQSGCSTNAGCRGTNRQGGCLR